MIYLIHFRTRSRTIPNSHSDHSIAILRHNNSKDSKDVPECASVADRLSLLLECDTTVGTEKKERVNSAEKVPSVADRLSFVLNSDNSDNFDKLSDKSKKSGSFSSSNKSPNSQKPPPIPPKRCHLNSNKTLKSVHCAESIKINTSTTEHGITHKTAAASSIQDEKSNSIGETEKVTDKRHSANCDQQDNISLESSEMARNNFSKNTDKMMSKGKDFLFPISQQSLSASVTVLVEKRCSGDITPLPLRCEDNVICRKKTTLHRSQSDLSCTHSRNSSDFSDLSSRLSRTSTELERFFNEMGIDRSVLDPMIKLQLNNNKDSDFFDSVSSLDLGSGAQGSEKSDSEHSQHHDKADTVDSVKKEQPKDTKAKTPPPVSNHVEKNARIIKWLSCVKKAQPPVNS